MSWKKLSNVPFWIGVVLLGFVVLAGIGSACTYAQAEHEDQQVIETVQQDDATIQDRLCEVTTMLERLKEELQQSRKELLECRRAKLECKLDRLTADDCTTCKKKVSAYDDDYQDEKLEDSRFDRLLFRRGRK